MAWYRAGTVAVTNGSAVITGSGTAWVGNVQIGHAINLPDGRAYEVLSVDSNSQITLGSPYLGGAASGQAYSVQPNQGFAQTAASRLTDYMTQVAQYVAGPLAGRFGDGSLAAPGMSFSADQDTGIRRYGENGISIVAGGIDRFAADSSGGAVYGRLAISAPNSEVLRLLGNGGAGTRIIFADTISSAEIEHNGGSLRFKYAGAIEGFRLDTSGNLLVGTSSAVGGGHVVAKPATEGQVIAALSSTSTGSNSLIAYAVTQQGWPAAAAAVVAGRNSQTNRSINAGGTVNASGADYAEYMIKAAGCGIIAKGDVCGVDRDGKLTKTWADAISFVVKSTDPSLVGGDTWSAHLPARPEQADDEADDAFASRLTEWEALLEKARQCVDRIAFCGQVPCNVTGDFEVGDYIVAAASGAGIKAVAVKPDDIAFPQYMRRIGKVWAIRDGRAWIDVQHG